MPKPSKYVKRGSPHSYIAARVPGPLDTLPSWFPVLERAGKLTLCGETGLVCYKAITGAWWPLNPGDWVVVQQGDESETGKRKLADVYGIEDADFRRMFDDDRRAV